jgi:hypothetical protein
MNDDRDQENPELNVDDPPDHDGGGTEAVAVEEQAAAEPPEHDGGGN